MGGSEGQGLSSSLSQSRHLCLCGRHPNKRFRSCTFSVTTTRHRNASHTRHNGRKRQIRRRRSIAWASRSPRLVRDFWSNSLRAETSAAAMTALLSSGFKTGIPILSPSGYRVALYNAIIQISSQSESVTAMRPSHVLLGLL